jgi:hypothetical protein
MRTRTKPPRMLDAGTSGVLEAIVARFPPVQVPGGFRTKTRRDDLYVRLYLERRATGATWRQLAERHGHKLGFIRDAIAKGRYTLLWGIGEHRLDDLLGDLGQFLSSRPRTPRD